MVFPWRLEAVAHVAKASRGIQQPTATLRGGEEVLGGVDVLLYRL